MKVADILRIKGSVVKTVPPHETALYSQVKCALSKLVPWS